MPLVGDRVELAPRPHRSFRRPLRRRLFHASAHAPAGRAPYAPSSCARPLQPPPSRPHSSPPSPPPPPVAPLRSPPRLLHRSCVVCGRDVCAVRVYSGSKGNPGSPRDGAGSPPDEANYGSPRINGLLWWFPVVFIVNCGSPRCKGYFRTSNCRPADRVHPPGAPVGRARAPAVATTPARRFCATRPCTLCLLNHKA